MKESGNIRKLAQLPIDFMGMIFYDKSPRFVNDLNERDIDFSKKRVGVFVNASREYILQMKEKYKLDMIQLHGDESPEFCASLRNHIPVMKVFCIENSSDFESTKRYEDSCDYFLFDTKTPYRGGSGEKFDWTILNEYGGSIPFFLSGGISFDDSESIKKISHTKLSGIDINSRFEIKPGLKNIDLINRFIKALKQ